MIILYIMSDKYYRGLRNILNDTKYKLQLASMTLKINENKNNISGIKNDISGINNFSDKINDNETNISTNLSKINDNKNNILSNLKIINTNKNNISFNLEQITDIKSLLPKSEIFKKTYGITNQSFRFTKNIIYFKLLEIEIENNFKIDGKLEFNSDIYYKYDNLQKDHHRLQHEYRIYDDKNNLLHKKILNKTNTSDLDFDKNIMLVKDNFYVTLNNNYNKIKIILDLFRVYRHGAGNFNLELINNSFVNITYLDKNDISLKIDTNTKDISSNLGKINTNVTDISSNLGKIDDNINAIKLINKNSQDNSKNISNNKGLISANTSKISSNKSLIETNTSSISSNLNEINYIKNNKSTQYLKNIYNILIYDSKTQIDFREDIFYEKIFDVNASINDFIEILFKIQLEYNNTDYRNYVKSIYELLDENNNSLYIKSVNNNQYNYFSNKMTIDENIFYNFNKDIKKIKFVIKFQKLSSTRVIYLYYIKNDNNRLILKHYGN